MQGVSGRGEIMVRPARIYRRKSDMTPEEYEAWKQERRDNARKYAAQRRLKVKPQPINQHAVSPDHKRFLETFIMQRRKYVTYSIQVTKRQLPEGCEVCGDGPILDYHHWDRTPIQPGQFIPGVWVCRSCHCNAHTTDSWQKSGKESSDFKYLAEFRSKYLVLKDLIIKEVGDCNRVA
jgi:hypothetical protein